LIFIEMHGATTKIIVTIYSFISILLHNVVKKQKPQNIQHKKLCKAGLGYEVVKAGPLCRISSQRHNLNNIYGASLFCYLAADGKVDLTRGFCWLCAVSGALGNYFFPLKEIVIKCINCLKLQ
jgi:hypothetical protein